MMNRLYKIGIGLLAMLVIVNSDLGAQDYLISDGGTVTTCSGTIYDSGGPDGNYSTNESFTMTFCADDVNACLQFDFVVWEVEGGEWEQFFVFDGPDTTHAMVGVYDGDTDPGLIAATGGCMTFHFTSDASVTFPGFEIDITCVCPTCDDGIMNGEEIGVDCGGPDCPECDFVVMGGEQTVNTCSTTVFDNGFNGNYAANSFDILTLCSDSVGGCLQAEFLEFDIEGEPWDIFTVFAGPDTTAPVYGTYGDFDPPAFINPGTECLTFQFVSDGIIQEPGYEIGISCACPTCDDGIMNGEEVGVDCGGPDCPDCPFIIMGGTQTVSTCDTVIFDNGFMGTYDGNSSDTLFLCSDDGSCILLEFAQMDLGFDDHLYIYDGTGTSGFLMAEYTNTVELDTLLSIGSCLTIVFESDDFGVDQGYELSASCSPVCPTCDDGIQNGQEIGVDCGGPDCPECPFIIMGGEQSQTTCSTTVYDNGFDENYEPNSNDILSLCSDSVGGCLQAEFISFDIEGEPWDIFTVYAGPDTTAPVFGSYGDFDPPTFINPGTECLTFEFVSDGIVQEAGYEIEISCVCPTCDDGIQNGQEIGVDCGGPDCPDCPFIIMGETQTVTTCDTTVFDNGFMGGYDLNSADTLTLCSDDGSCLLLEFASVDIGFDDHLYIYDGVDDSGFLIADITSTEELDTLLSIGSCVTLIFESDGFGVDQGFELNVTCTPVCPTCDDGILNGQEIGVDCGGPDCPECPFIVMGGEQSQVTCSTTVYDNGYLDDYDPNSYDVLTLCSDSIGGCLQAEFISFDIEGEPWDILTVYAGPDIDSPVIGSYGDLDPPTFINAGSECLTFEFVSDGIVQQAGYEIAISCVCPTCDDGIQNGEEIGVDCGGPDCPSCEPTEQDCLGANVVCQDVYVQEAYVPEPGLFPITLPVGQTCLDEDVSNAVWYTFTIQEDGLLSFILTPQENADDYDWGLFDLTSATCADIETDAEALLVSCNSYGLNGDNGPTGISTANGGVGNSNGPGDTNGPAFNEDLPVQAGQTYVLLVQNWTGSNDGYTLDFSQSSAELFNPVGPDLENVEFVNCSNLLVQFGNPVDCETVDAGDFILTSSTQTYTVDSISDPCTGQGGTVSEVELFVSPPFADTPDSITVSFVPGAGVVLDLCDNPVPTDTSYTFVTPDWIQLQTQVTNTICDFELGEIAIIELTGGVEPYIVSFEGDVTTDTVFNSLAVGDYTIHVLDDAGCETSHVVPVISEFLNSELDTITFNACNAFTVSFTEDVDCTTFVEGQVSVISSEGQHNVTLVSSDCTDDAGSEFIFEVDPLFPDRTDSIVFNLSVNGEVILDLCGDPVAVADSYSVFNPQWITTGLQVEPTECLNDIGSIAILDVFGTTGSYEITFEGEPVELGFVADGLSIGYYPIEITDSLGCHLFQEPFIGTDPMDVDVLMPNIFSPNDDELNSHFGPFSIQRSDETNLGLIDVGTYYDVYDLEIFNRWGRQVFKSSNSERFWDGSDGGSPAPEGTYYYVIKYHEACPVEEKPIVMEKGYLTLVR